MGAGWFVPSNWRGAGVPQLPAASTHRFGTRINRPRTRSEQGPGLDGGTDDSPNAARLQSGRGMLHVDGSQAEGTSLTSRSGWCGWHCRRCRSGQGLAARARPPVVESSPHLHGDTGRWCKDSQSAAPGKNPAAAPKRGLSAAPPRSGRCRAGKTRQVANGAAPPGGRPLRLPSFSCAQSPLIALHCPRWRDGRGVASVGQLAGRLWGVSPRMNPWLRSTLATCSV